MSPQLSLTLSWVLVGLLFIHAHEGSSIYSEIGFDYEEIDVE